MRMLGYSYICGNEKKWMLLKYRDNCFMQGIEGFFFHLSPLRNQIQKNFLSFPRGFADIVIIESLFLGQKPLERKTWIFYLA